MRQRLHLAALLLAAAPCLAFATGTMPVKDATGATVTVPIPAAQGTAGTPSADVLTVQGATGMTALKVDGSAVTQPVSGTVAVSNFPATQAVSGPLTDAQMRATPINVAGTFWQATQPVSLAAVPLPTGAATDAKLQYLEDLLTDINTYIGGIDGTNAQIRDRTPVLGQATMANSSPVVLASNQSAIPVTGTFWQATQPVSGTFWQATQPISAAALPLPSGAATETTLAAINTKQPALGQAVKSGSVPVTVASDQGTLSVAEIDGLSVSGSVTSATSLFSQDCAPGSGAAAYRSCAVQVTSAGTTCTITYEGSNDNSTWVSIAGFDIASASAAAVTTSTTTGVRVFPVTTRYFRARVSTYTSGTVSAVALFRAEPISKSAIFATAAQSGTWTVQPGNTANTTAWLMTMATPTLSAINSAATTNATSVKASAGTVFSVTCSNTNAAARYVKFYNKASAPTVGTDVPVITLTVPATSTVNFVFAPQGVRLGTGIALAITASMADSDTTAVAANEIKVLTSYL